MIIHVTAGEEKHDLDMPERATPFSVITVLGMYPDSVLVLKNGNVMPEDEQLSAGDSIELIRIASGG